MTLANGHTVAGTAVAARSGIGDVQRHAAAVTVAVIPTVVEFALAEDVDDVAADVVRHDDDEECVLVGGGCGAHDADRLIQIGHRL